MVVTEGAVFVTALVNVLASSTRIAVLSGGRSVAVSLTTVKPANLAISTVDSCAVPHVVNPIIRLTANIFTDAIRFKAAVVHVNLVESRYVHRVDVFTVVIVVTVLVVSGSAVCF